MSVEVLKSKLEIANARQELCRRGLSFAPSRWRRLAQEVGVFRGINVGDELKSWDVLKTVDFIERNISKGSPILDIGAFASELPCILHKLGYTNLAGVDLNPNIKKMPYAKAVRYEVSDFLDTPFENQSFQAITAISVIEHGFNSELLLTEVSRILRPGGLFIASFDYWPGKIDTRGMPIFGMDWTIFSEQEVHRFLQEANGYDLAPHGDVNLAGGDKAIHFARKDYTFAWLALQKTGKRLSSEP
jgi:SAM-dependent methyltransferase